MPPIVAPDGRCKYPVSRPCRACCLAWTDTLLVSLDDALRLGHSARSRPIQSADDLAGDGIFESDEELDEFLAYTYAARRADLA